MGYLINIIPYTTPAMMKAGTVLYNSLLHIFHAKKHTCYYLCINAYTKKTHLFFLVTTRRSVKRKKYSVHLEIRFPKVNLPSFSLQVNRVSSPFLTNQRDAEISGMAFTSLKSSCLERISISSIRSILRAPSLHSATICL